MSATAVRQNAWIGVTQRRHSSTAPGIPLGVGGEPGALVGVLGERDDTAGEQRAGGLVAGDEQREQEDA